MKEIFEEIAENHDIEIDTLEVAEDHVHIFLSFSPSYSISKVAGMLLSDPKQTPILLEEKQSQGVGTGRFSRACLFYP